MKTTNTKIILTMKRRNKLTHDRNNENLLQNRKL